MLKWLAGSHRALSRKSIALGLALGTLALMPLAGQAAHHKRGHIHFFAHQNRHLHRTVYARGPAVPLTPDPIKDAALVIDGNTGRAIYGRNATEIRHPASLTKMMTLYLLFDALKTHQVTLDTPLPVSAHAAAQKPTKLALRPGDTIPVDIAIKAIVVRSANDVAVTIAEALGGSEAHFAQMMTAKAHELGMYNTYYQNASGLPDPGQLTTASDLAVLARHLAYDDPQYYHYFSTIGFSWRGIPYITHNNLIGKYEGADGIKTGYTGASGFNLVSSVVRNGNHIIGVVMGGRTSHSRDRDMVAMLDSTFARINANPTLVARANVPWQSAAQNVGSTPVLAGFGVASVAPQQTTNPAKWLVAALTPHAKETPKYPDQEAKAVPKYPDQDEDSAEAAPAPQTVATALPTAPKPAPAPIAAPPVVVAKQIPAPQPAPAQIAKASLAQAAPSVSRLALAQIPIPKPSPVQSPPPVQSAASTTQLALAQIPVPKASPGYAPPALQRVALLEPKSRPVITPKPRRDDIGEGDTNDEPNLKRGMWTVQIGAFADTTMAKNRLADFASKSPDVLAHAQKLVVPLQSASGKVLYRARFGPFAERDARETCVRMMERGQACFAVATR